MNKGILLYIDPGTGAMLFTVIVGIVSTLIFALQDLMLRIKYFISKGNNGRSEYDKMGIVIFTDSKRYWNVFEAICSEFEKRKIECHYWTASVDDPVFTYDYKYVKPQFIGEGNKAYAKLNIMRAYICISSTPGLDVYQWKRSRYVDYYIHIPHEIGEITAYRMFGIDYYDSVLLNGEFQKKDIRQLEKLRGLPSKELVVVGSPCMDYLKHKIEVLNVGIDDKKEHDITVLIAPSWGKDSILNKYEDRFLNEIKKTGYNVIIRPHPQSLITDYKLIENLKKQFPEGDNWSWNFDNDNFDVLSKSDIIISDFSGIIFDFALAFNKPVIYADTYLDRSPYDSCWIEKQPWRFEVLPKIGKQLREGDFSDLKSLIEGLIDNEEYQNGRVSILSEAWEYQGESAKRVVDYVALKLSKNITTEME